MHNNASIFLNEGVCPADSTAQRVAKVKAMLRPGDDCYVIDSKDPTDAIANAVSRLRAAGVESFVYGRGDDRALFPGRDWLEANRVPIKLFKDTEGVSGTALREKWWVRNKPKLLADSVAVRLLHAYDGCVYEPLKNALIQSVAAKLPAQMLLPNAIISLALLLTTLPFVAAVRARRFMLAVFLAVMHDLLDRLNAAVAVTCATRRAKRDGDFGGFLDAICHRVFGIAQLMSVALYILMSEASEMIMSIDQFAIALGEGNAGRYTLWSGFAQRTRGECPI